MVECWCAFDYTLGTPMGIGVCGRPLVFPRVGGGVTALEKERTPRGSGNILRKTPDFLIC